jgi:uncharacterized MAPEG superfamily protein
MALLSSSQQEATASTPLIVSQSFEPTQADPSAPKPIIPISGAILGTIFPYLFYIFFTPKNEKTASDKIDNVLIVLQSLSLPSLLFFSEFCWGVLARAQCTKASFSPAAAQASGIVSFPIVECNRIHQNHIESACIYIPACLSAAAAGADANILVATTVSWVLFRCIYRWGYRQHSNPLLRVVGTVASLTQSGICLGLFVHAKYIQ